MSAKTKYSKNQYQKAWRKANPDKVRAYAESYLKRIAEKQEAEYLRYNQQVWDLSKKMDSKDIALKLNISVNSVIRIYLRKYITV